MSSLLEHNEKWNKCTECLFSCRPKVLYRGFITCDVLFVGDIPSVSEKVFNSPFRGETRWLLDSLIDQLNEYCANEDIEFTWGATHVLACPPDESKPKKANFKSCYPRIVELVEIVKPKLVVLMGNEASDLALLLGRRQVRMTRGLSWINSLVTKSKHKSNDLALLEIRRIVLSIGPVIISLLKGS